MEPRPVKKENKPRNARSPRVAKSSGSGYGLLIGGVIGILVAVVALVAGLIWALSVYTRHDKEIQLPDFVGLSVPQATELAAETEVRTMVVDTIFNRGVPRGSVVRQVPSAGSMVKKNRTVRLTINALAPRNIPVPDLIDEPFKTALSDLDKWGFELGRLTYVKDRATNRVIRQMYRGRDVKAGTLVPGGSSIDLVLGLAEDDMLVKVPCAIGMDYKAAVRAVKAMGLNTGSVIFDREVRTYQDSMSARVYKQNPNYLHQYHYPGGSVSLYLTLDENKIPQIVVEAAEDLEGEEGPGTQGAGSQGFGAGYDAGITDIEIVED